LLLLVVIILGGYLNAVGHVHILGLRRKLHSANRQAISILKITDEVKGNTKSSMPFTNNQLLWY
jgi:hypothetical protein